MIEIFFRFHKFSRDRLEKENFQEIFKGLKWMFYICKIPGVWAVQTMFKAASSECMKDHTVYTELWRKISLIITDSYNTQLKQLWN